MELTWYSIEGSFNEFLQMAQVSAQMSQDHIVTAFHFLISNLIALEEPPSSLVTSSDRVSFSSAILHVRRAINLKLSNRAFPQD